MDEQDFWGEKKSGKLWLEFSTFTVSFIQVSLFIFLWVLGVAFIYVSYLKHLNSLLCLDSSPSCSIPRLRGSPQHNPCFSTRTSISFWQAWRPLHTRARLRGTRPCCTETSRPALSGQSWLGHFKTNSFGGPLHTSEPRWAILYRNPWQSWGQSTQGSMAKAFDLRATDISSACLQKCRLNEVVL